MKYVQTITDATVECVVEVTIDCLIVIVNKYCLSPHSKHQAKDQSKKKKKNKKHFPLFDYVAVLC